MTRLYIIRHAEAEGNLYRRIHGWYDSDVTGTGYQQIAALERRFRDIPVDAAYASDLRRTQITAQAVVRPKGLELHIDPQLREISLGVYEDRTFGDALYHDPEELAYFRDCSSRWSPQGGETFAQVARRVSAAVLRIAQAHPGQTVAIFTHGTAIKCLLSAIRGRHPSETPEVGHPENTAVTCLDVEDSKVAILFENDASHLSPDLATLARQRQRAAAGAPLPQVWFKLLDMDSDEAALYYEARKSAWLDIHGSLLDFDGPGLLSEAREQWFLDHRAVQLAMWNDRPVGILHLATARGAAEGAGWISFFYLAPDCRRQGMGVQLLGQAVCSYRAMGRDRLRLHCAPDNTPAQAFYRRYGFQKVGSDPGARGDLDLLEKSI